MPNSPVGTLCYAVASLSALSFSTTLTWREHGRWSYGDVRRLGLRFMNRDAEQSNVSKMVWLEVSWFWSQTPGFRALSLY